MLSMCGVHALRLTSAGSAKGAPNASLCAVLVAAWNQLEWLSLSSVSHHCKLPLLS
jgi:hypothetical protein